MKHLSIICLLSATAVVAQQDISVAQPTDAVTTQQQTIVKLFGAGVGNLDSYGSGVLISEEGHIATVWNHLVNTGYLTAVTFDGQRFDVEVVGTSLDHDLAILKLEFSEPPKLPFVNLQESRAAAAGDSILAFSNVYHVATGNEPVSVMHGVVACETVLEAGLGRWKFPVKSPVYLIDAVTNNSGAAGGLVTTADGKPLGLLGREIRHTATDMWVNYAVPWQTLLPAVEAILDGRRLSSTSSEEDRRLLSGRELTSQFGLTVLPGLLPKTPAYIDRVIPSSPAAKASLQRGDLVLMLNNTVIQSVDDLRAAFAEFRSGQRVRVTVNRKQAVSVHTLVIP